MFNTVQIFEKFHLFSERISYVYSEFHNISFKHFHNSCICGFQPFCLQQILRLHVVVDQSRCYTYRFEVLGSE